VSTCIVQRQLCPLYFHKTVALYSDNTLWSDFAFESADSSDTSRGFGRKGPFVFGILLYVYVKSVTKEKWNFLGKTIYTPHGGSMVVLPLVHAKNAMDAMKSYQIPQNALLLL